MCQIALGALAVRDTDARLETESTTDGPDRLPEIRKASICEKPILRHLLELRQHDTSEYDGADIGEHGFYGYRYLDHYWTEPSRHPFLVRVGGKLAGFALVRDLSEGGQTRSTRWLSSLSCTGTVARAMACQIFDRFPGQWRVAQDEGNLPARAFWKRIISQYTGGRSEEVRDPAWQGPIQAFVVPQGGTGAG